MFERLTYKAKNGLFALHKGGLPENVQEAFARLAAYEDIGLSPERIKQILDSRPLHRIEKGQIIVDKDAFNHCNELATAYSKIGTVNEFAELAKAKAEGRLVILPCKVGDTVYRIISYKCNAVCNKLNACNSFIYKGCKQAEFYVCSGTFQLNDMWWIGKIVFLTREEAEKALKGAEKEAQ